MGRGSRREGKERGGKNARRNERGVWGREDCRQRFFFFRLRLLRAPHFPFRLHLKGPSLPASRALARASRCPLFRRAGPRRQAFRCRGGIETPTAQPGSAGGAMRFEKHLESRKKNQTSSSSSSHPRPLLLSSPPLSLSLDLSITVPFPPSLDPNSRQS